MSEENVTIREFEARMADLNVRHREGIEAVAASAKIALEAKEAKDAQLRWIIGLVVSVLGIVEIYLLSRK
jgi:uncharacterized protein YjeT (DUF2065 family)